MSISTALKITIREKGYIVGSVDKDVEKLPNEMVEKIKDRIGEVEDFFFTKEDNENEVYVVELDNTENEIDIRLLDGYDYFTRYGILENSYEFDDITEEQYNYYRGMGV